MTDPGPIIGYPSLNAQHKFTADSTFGVFNAAYPRRNMFSDNMKAVARTFDATLASTIIQLEEIGANMMIGAIALIKTNLSLAATIRIEITAGPDSGFISVFPSGDRGDGSFYYLFNPEVASGGIKISINDTANTDGYIEIAYIHVSRMFQLSSNYVAGAGRGRSFRSTSTQIQNGRKIFSRRPSFRTFQGTYRINNSDMFHDENGLYDLWRFADRDDPFLLFTRPDDSTNFVRHTFFCRNASNKSDGVFIDFDLNEVKISVKDAR